MKDNAACIAQIRGAYFKGDRTKHISPKFFYTRELQHDRKIDVKQIRSTNNFANLSSKALPTLTFDKLVHNIGMRQFNKLLN